MERVIGIGGVFIKSENPDALRSWYHRHLGMKFEEWGGVIFHSDVEKKPTQTLSTVWSVFEASSEYFAPSSASFMINYRVRNLESLLTALRQEGCDVDERVEESELGKFGWVMDPDGNRVELWEPPAQ